MIAQVSTDMGSIAKSLFLEVVVYFPNHLGLSQSGEGGDIREICWVEKGFQNSNSNIKIKLKIFNKLMNLLA